jgi:hypothetical protein
VSTVIRFRLIDRGSGCLLQEFTTDLSARIEVKAATPYIDGDPAAIGYVTRIQMSDDEAPVVGESTTIEVTVEPTPALLEAGTMVDDPLPGWSGSDCVYAVVVAQSATAEITPDSAYLEIGRLAKSNPAVFTVTPLDFPALYAERGETRKFSLPALEAALGNYFTRSPDWRRELWAQDVLMDEHCYPGVLPPSLITAARKAIAEIEADRHTKAAALQAA